MLIPISQGSPTHNLFKKSFKKLFIYSFDYTGSLAAAYGI